MDKLKYLLLFPLILALTACKTPSIIDQYEGQSATQIYADAYKALKKGNQFKAIQTYKALEALYPYGDYTEQSQLDIIYAYYIADEYPAALNAADRFIRLHPRNPNIDYAFYMKGLIKFNEDVSFYEKVFPIDPSRRDVSHERESYVYFDDFLRRFPNSEYAPDARQRLVYIRNSMAKNEYFVGEYYYNRGAYLAAANRARVVLDSFPGTEITPDALVLMIKSYKRLGLTLLTEDTTRILTLNFPEKLDSL